MAAAKEVGRAVYIISVAAELAGVHPQTLRTYERKGLLKPARTPGGTRRYSARDVARVQLIQELTQQGREKGVNLAGVQRILEMQDEIDRLHDELDEARRTVEKVRAEARRAISEATRRTGTEIVLYRPSAIEPHPYASRGRR